MRLLNDTGIRRTGSTGSTGFTLPPKRNLLQPATGLVWSGASMLHCTLHSALCALRSQVCQAGLVFLLSHLALCRPLSIHSLPPLSQPFPSPSSTIIFCVALGIFPLPRVPHEPLQFMICFRPLPCQPCSNLFVPRGASCLVSSPNLNLDFRPREPIPRPQQTTITTTNSHLRCLPLRSRTPIISGATPKPRRHPTGGLLTPSTDLALVVPISIHASRRSTRPTTRSQLQSQSLWSASSNETIRDRRFPRIPPSGAGLRDESHSVMLPRRHR